MIKVSLKEILKMDVSILNKYFLVTLILVLLTIVGYTSYALFSYEEVSGSGIRLKYTGEIIANSLAFNWRTKTTNEASYLAIYTLDSKDLPSTYTYNGTTYTLNETIDVSERQNNSVLLGEYQNGSNMIAVITQEKGVVAPIICYELFKGLNVTTIDLSNLDTSKVTNMAQMFANCASLTSLNLSNLDTSNVTNMYYMFRYCSSLTSLDLSSFDTTNVTDSEDIFDSGSSLTSVTVGCNWTISYSSSNLSITKVCDEEETDKIDNPKNCLSKSWKAKTNDELLYVALYTIDTLDFPDTYDYEGTTYTLDSTYDVSEQENGSVILKEYKNDDNFLDISYVAIIGQEGGVVAPSNSFGLFAIQGTNSLGAIFGTTVFKLQTMDLSNLDTSNVTEMTKMFYGCTKLTALDLSGFDTSNVTNMRSMFDICIKLTSLDLSNFDTFHVVDFLETFKNCSSLTSITVGCNFTTENAFDTTDMFTDAGVSSVTKVCD